MEPDKKAASTLAPGLYVVATPIGNLEDITLRALRILKEVDLIACEDTRHTQKLLNHYSITTRTISYHEHNEASRTEELVQQLKNGLRIALVTDAGMPGISDPGYRVIAKSVEHRIAVVPIPGASAFVAALAASGLPTDSFEFRGFLPSKISQRRNLLESIKGSQQVQIFYEAPHRMTDTLEDIVEILGTNCPVVIAREVTKLHEEFLRGTAGELLGKQPEEWKGEITLLIGKSAESTEHEMPEKPATVSQQIEKLMAEENLDEKAALKRVAKEMGISKSEAYRKLQKSRSS
jgi:16S rRNA (cytidine1402-2'-O)-methyltransferase